MTDGSAISMDVMKDSPLEYEQMTDEERSAFWNSWTKVVSGEEAPKETPKSKTELVKGVYDSIDNQLEGHLSFLATQQKKELEPLPTLTPDSSADEQLQLITTLVKNINVVQNGNNAGITPHLSKELNGMDCSMSTWTMQHELTKEEYKKAGVTFAWGSPVGHAVGIVKLKDGQTYYADGQGGFIEKIDIEKIPLLHGGEIVTIKNYTEIQAKHKSFFPKYIFSSDTAGLAATMGNIDSMIYKQYTGEITDEMRKKSPEDAILVEQLQPFAKEYKQNIGLLDPGRKQTVLNQISDSLFPNVNDFRNSPQAQEDKTRLNPAPHQ